MLVLNFDMYRSTNYFVLFVYLICNNCSNFNPDFSPDFDSDFSPDFVRIFYFLSLDFGHMIGIIGPENICFYLIISL